MKNFISKYYIYYKIILLIINFFFFRNQRASALKSRTDMYENKIARMKDYYLEEIKERDEKLAVICLI